MTKHLTSEQSYEIYLGRKRGWSRSRVYMIKNQALNKLTSNSLPLEFDFSEFGIKISIKELRQFLLEKSHFPSTFFCLRIYGAVDVDYDDSIILGDYDETALINALNKYFNEENRAT